MVKKETQMTDNAKLYELGFHILSTVPENKVADAFADISEVIIKNKGSIVKSGEPKAKKLAYTIIKKVKGKNEKFKTAYFAWIKFTMDPADINAIKTAMDANENVLRYIIVKTVDDDEHSTIKLVEETEETEEVVMDSESEEVSAEEVESEVASEGKEKVVYEIISEEKPEAVDEIDQAIEDLVEEK